MASKRTKVVAVSLVALALSAGYGWYLTAQVSPPELAQAPMNITNVIPPAFIMAVDDSGSMTFETMFPGRDGYGCTGTGTSNPFFNANGTLRTAAGTSGSCNFHHLFPYPGHRIGTDRYAIPPIDLFGFARSPSYNASYYNPGTVYVPWKNYDNTNYPQASITATLSNPRDANSPTFDMTSLHRDRTDDGDPGNLETGNSTYNNGTLFPAGIIYRRNGNCGGLASTGTAWNTLANDVTLSANCDNISIRRPQVGQPAADELFRIPTGVTLPRGTRYYRLADGACGGLASARPTQRIWVELQAAHTLTAVCELGIEYFPATFYLPLDTAAPAGFITANRTLATNAGGPGVNLYRYEIKPSNYSTTAAYNQQISNFANWFSYYGNRNRAMIAGMTHSLVDVNNMRIGYFTINQHGSRDEPDSKTAERVTMYDMAKTAAGEDKSKLYSAMISLPASGSTPNRQAVNAIGKQFLRRDEGAPIKLSCQKNAGMLFTDGYSNQDGPTVSNANGDGNMGAPFSDSHDNTMADIAAYYYRTNLRSDLNTGQVKVDKSCPAGGGDAADKRIDCQRNLHMNFYGVTLGARGNLFNPDAEQDPYTDASIYNNWPSRQNDNPSTVDDIWHATVNTRGEFINARTPSDITAAMRRIIAAVNEGSTPSGTIGVTGSRIGSGSLNIQPAYDSSNYGTDWYSRLTAEAISADSITGTTGFAEVWEASSRLATQPSRTIRFGKTGSSVVPTVRNFDASNVTLGELCSGALSRCSATQLQALGSGSMTLTRAVAYLRGSKVDEGVLRTRTTILGDIVNSSPILSAPIDNYGYRALGGSLASSYATFLENKKTSGRPLVVVGANDGMFHVFDGRTDGNGGREVFAYIPAAVLGHMGNLLFPYVAADKNDQKFQHRYYVDGPVTVSDVNVGGVWKTIAVGTTGAGGRSVFALDITNPDSVQVLWEVNNLITGNAAITGNIGNVLGKPVIVPVKSTAGAVSWKVIFGNGYNSTNQQARLFVVDAGTGAVTTIEANEGASHAYNGLGNIAVIDRKRVGSDGTVSNGRDGYSDTVYAADQQGAIWKFDLLNNNVALGGKPLFVARDASDNRQPILGGLTAASGPGGGVMLYFGTGSFSFLGDPDSTAIQTIYAVNDRGVPLSGRGQLQQQTIIDTANGRRETSTTAMAIGRQGWYLDLPAGERFVGYPRIESGIVFFPTYAPTGATGDDCGVSGVNWLYGLNSLTGGAALSYVRLGSGKSHGAGTGAIALDTKGTAPVKDVAVMTMPRVPLLTGTPTAAEINAAADARCSMVVRVAGAEPMYIPRPCGRQSWRQVR
ncbi:pilus assembly protein [Pseudoxanthomonas mexicana]|uniref:pilus assembly protein n=1 Tax=Pseudoxanthomonas mexicana TaxID=128785 RepID=UPI00398A5743